MSLKGAKLICLNKNGSSEKIIKPEGKSFRFGYYITCDYVLVNPEAKSIHCEILIDAFSRITIVNYCNKNPITINGFPVKNQRPLFHGNKIKILNKEFVWHFSGKNDRDEITDSVDVLATVDSMDVLATPSHNELSEQAPLSEPWKIRNYKMKKRRLSVQSIGKEELNKINESNNEITPTKTTIDSYEIKENIPLDLENILTNKNTPTSTNKTSTVRRRTLDCLTPLTSTITATTLINFNTSIYKDENMTPQAKLELCKTSGVLVTSYSPRTLNNRTPQSFALIKSNKNTPQSIYGTPRSVLSEHNNEDSNDGTNLMNFSTPKRTGKNDYHKSMYLIDLTTPAIIQKTPVKQIVPSPLLKSALKNSTHKSAIKSVKRIKTTFAPVMEETNNSLIISGEKKKYPVTPSSAKSISSVRKSLNMSINTKENLTITPNKMKTPVKTTLIPNESNKNLNISSKKIINISNNSETDSNLNYKTPTSNLLSKEIDSTIEIEDASIHHDNDDEDEDSIIVVTDDSIYSNESIRNINQTPQKETPNRKVYKNIAQKTPTSLIRKAIISSATKIKRSPNMLVLVSKRLPSASSTSSFNLNSSSKLTTTPLRKSLVSRKISPRSVGKSRLSFRSSSIGIDKTPGLPTSTPLRTNIKLRKSTSFENRSLPLLNIKRPKIHSCKNESISTFPINSTPINSKNICRNTSAKLKLNLSKASATLNSSKIRNIVDRTNNTDANNAKGDIEIGEESELNQTFTITGDVDNQIKAKETIIEEDDNMINTTPNVCMKTPEEKEEISLKELVSTPKILSKENDLINVFGVKELLQTTKDILTTPNMIGVKELLQTPKQDIVNNFVGVTELFNTPNNHDSILNSTAIIELFKTPIKDSDIKQFMDTPKIDQSILGDRTEDQIFKTISAKNLMVSSITPERKSISQNFKCTDILESAANFGLGCHANVTDDNIFKTPKTNITEQISEENYCKRIESSDEIFDKLIGTPTITKQYSPAKKSCAASISIIPETPKTDIQEWIDNINESLPLNESCDNIDNSIQEIYENSNSDCKSNSKKIHKTQHLKKYDESEETLNKSCRNCSNISIANPDESKSVFSEELALSDKSGDDEFIDYQSTPNIKRKLSTSCAVNYTTPVRRSSRHLNKSYGCKQCLTPPANTSNTKLSLKLSKSTLVNQMFTPSFDMQSRNEREMMLAFENFSDQPIFSDVKAKTPQVRIAKIHDRRKTLGYQTEDTSFDLKAAKEERETELAFENFTDQPNLPEIKAKTPDLKKAKMQNNRKTLGNKTADCSFDLNAAKEERETELAFENFTDQPNLPEIKAKTPDVKKAKMKNNRKTLGNKTVDCSFDLKAAKEERETELAFENFTDQPNLPEIKAKTPDVKKAKMQNNRKTLGNKTVDCSFDLKAAKEERETELAFENFTDQPNLPEIKAKTPDVKKAKMQNNRKTLGNKTVDCSFDLKAAKEERETELAFENFTDQPNLPEIKAKTPDVKKAKTQNNRKTLGNKTADCSFDLKAAKEERETELAFENFTDQPNLPEIKAKTPDVKKAKMQNNRKTLGNKTVDCSFDLKAAKEERETELAFENFTDQPNLPEIKAKTPDVKKAKMQNNRKTLGNKTVDCSFDLKAAKEERETELAFENFTDQPNLPEIKAKTPDVKKAKMQNNRKTLGNKTVDCSFDVKAAKEERETELAFENFTDQPNLPEIKAKTPDVKKAKMQNNRKTLGNKTVDCSFDLKAAKEEREIELAFENFTDQPNLPEIKAKTPDVKKAKMQNNRKTLGNKTVDCSFDLRAAKEERETELAFENFTDQPNIPEIKAKTPDVKKAKMQNNRKTLGNKTVDCSFDLKAAKEEREIELAFENFTDQPNLPEIKAKTPDVKKAKMQNNRKTLGNKTVDCSFDLKAAKEERETELAFENFTDQPNLPEIKAKTPDVKKAKMQNNRKTLGNKTVDCSFDVKAAKEERETELAFENFTDQPNLPEIKAKTPDVKKAKMQNNRKTLGNKTVDCSFDLKAAKEERETELAFENFTDQPNIPEIKAKTPDVKKAKTQNNRKTLGNKTADCSFDLKAAKEERETELAFENFIDQPNLPEVKAKTPDVKKAKIQNNRKTLGNKTVDCSFDLKSAKEELETELAFENFTDQPNLLEVKSKTPDVKYAKIQNNRKTLGNQTVDTSFDLETAKEEREKELAFENFHDQPNLPIVKLKTPDDKSSKIQNNRKTLGNQTVDISLDLENAKDEQEIELAFVVDNDRKKFPNSSTTDKGLPSCSTLKVQLLEHQNHDTQVSEVDIYENNSTLLVKTIKTRGRARKKTNVNECDEVQLCEVECGTNQYEKTKFDEEIIGNKKTQKNINDTKNNEEVLIKDTPVKRLGRGRKTNVKKEMQDFTDENEVIERTPLKGRKKTKNQIKIKNIIESTSVQKDEISSTDKGKGREEEQDKIYTIVDNDRNKFPNNSTAIKDLASCSTLKEHQHHDTQTSEVEIFENNSTLVVKTIKTRGKARKNPIVNECDQVPLFKVEYGTNQCENTEFDEEIIGNKENQKNINDTKNNEEVLVKDTPVKRLGRGRKANVKKEMQNYTDENEVIESAPPKGRNKTKNQIKIKNIIESTSVQKDEISTTDNAKGSDKKPISTEKINPDIKQEFDEEQEIVIKSPPIKGRGRTRNQRKTVIDNTDIDDEKESSVNKKTKVKSQDVKKNNEIKYSTNDEEKNIDGEVSTPRSTSRRNLKVISYSEENDNDAQISSNSNVTRGRIRKNNVSNDVSINSEDDTIAQQKVTTKRNKTKKDYQKISETNNSIIDTDKKEIIITKIDDNTNSVTTDDHKFLLQNSKQLNINTSDMPEFKTPTNELLKKRAIPAHRLRSNSTATPILNEENQTSVVVRRSKRKIADEIDSSASEEVNSAELITRGRRRRINTNLQINSEDRAIKQINNTGVEQDHKNNEIDKKVEINNTLDKGTGRDKKPMITDEINPEIKKDFDEEKENLNTPVKGRGRTRNQRQTVIDNTDLDEEKTSKVNIDEVCTPTTRSRRNLKVIKSEENNDIAEISSNPNVSRGRLKKNNVSNDVNMNSEDDTIPQQKVTTKRNKTKKNYQKSAETNNSIIDTDKKEIIITKKDDNTNSVSTDEHILLESCHQININPSNLPEFKTPTNKVLKKSAMPARRLRSNSTATPILNEENQTSVAVRRSKRKVADENDSSASEEVYSAESNKRGGRRRINTELQPNSEGESEAVEPLKNNRGKRKLVEIPIEVDVSEKRSTRKRK